LINNDGNFSLCAAELLFASLLAAEQAGSIPSQVFCLELGIGVGLFARLFLSAFQDLCQQRGKDYFDRLTYIVADHSEPMLLDTCRHGVFANHPGRYILRVVDAVRPVDCLKSDLVFAEQSPRPLHAVFLNYILDCLPPTILELQGDEVRELVVRTCLARSAKLEGYTDLTVHQLAGLACSPIADTRELLNVYHLFASEYDYRSVDVSRIPYGDFATEFGRRHTRRVLHNYGAIQSLEGLLKLLREDGFILINDYGPTQLKPSEEYEHQRFSNATSIGLNFPLLKAYFADHRKYSWSEPEEENEHIHSRLLSHHPASATVETFKDRFGKASFERTREPARQARELVKAGRLEAAASCFHKALEYEPYNWSLMSEIAFFLTYSLRSPT
jgi:hypothetical protein